MGELRTIEIDFDVHKKIEAERTSFSESPNDVLRRLLRLGNAAATEAAKGRGRSWSGKGVTLPDGTLQLTRGGVFSYYEFVHDINDRMTDDAWRAQVASGDLPPRPAWTSAFFSE